MILSMDVRSTPFIALVHKSVTYRDAIYTYDHVWFSVWSKGYASSLKGNLEVSPPLPHLSGVRWKDQSGLCAHYRLNVGIQEPMQLGSSQPNAEVKFHPLRTIHYE